MRIRFQEARDFSDLVSVVDITAGDDLEAVLELEKDSWYIRNMSTGGAIGAFIRAPADYHDVYEPGEVESLGLKLDIISTFISDKSEPLEIRMENEQSDGGKIQLLHDGYRVDMWTVEQEYIETKADNNPTLDHEVVIDAPLGYLKTFASKADRIVDSSSAYFVDADGDGILLYAEGDTRSIENYTRWDEFGDQYGGYDLDWGVNNTGKGSPFVPQKDNRISVIMSIDITRQLYEVYDMATIRIANGAPLQVLFKDEDKDNSLAFSYFQSPRIPGAESKDQVPKEVKENVTP